MNEWVDVRLVLYTKSGKEVKKDSELYKILNAIKIPTHLTSVELRVQKFKDMDSSLIFVGVDSKGRKQYFYGKDHVAGRTSNRIKLLLHVYKKKDKVFKFVEKQFKKSSSLTMDYVFAVFLSIELKFYIRMGKEKYFKDNQTIGMNTLTKDHIKIGNKFIEFDFVGKVGVSQHFKLPISDPLAAHVISLYNNPNNKSNFFFVDYSGKRFSENMIYDQMKSFGIKIKDLRTYGANKTLIETYIKAIKKSEPLKTDKDKKKFMSDLIETTAGIIGHTPAICKKSYLVLELLDILKNDWFYENRKSLTVELVFDKLKEYVEKNKSIEEGKEDSEPFTDFKFD
ncbi:DNA topoisomerase I [Carp edema virus]|nr:DNA topoisomerase I [Carp edema virus]